MKKLLLVTLFFLAGLLATQAQSLSTITFSEPNNNLPELGDNFNVPVNVAGFLVPVRYVEVIMEYDPAVLSFVGVTNLQNPSCLVNITFPDPGAVKINYNQVVLSFDVTDGKLFDIQFNYLEGASTLVFGEESRYRFGSTILTITDLTPGALLGIFVNNNISGGDWNLAENWSKGILPDAFHNVFIQGLTTIGSEAVCNKLTIETGRQLIIADNGTLTVSGLMTNLAGTTGLIIESSADGTGSLIHATPGVRANVHRYTGAPESAKHQISSPVEDQAISPEFTDGSIFSWFEPAQSWISYFNSTVWPTWTDVNNNEFFTSAKGYMVSLPFVGGNPQTKEFSGDLNTGTISLNLSFQAHPADYHRGFNLAGNPYPSSIDWKAPAGWSRSSLILSPGDQDGYSFWIWNPVLGQYGTYHSGQISETGTAGTSRYIAPMQGFWVRAAEAGILGMDNSIRVHSSQPWMKSEKSETGVLKLSVSSDVNAYRDEVILEFGHETNLGGSEKMFSLYPAAPGLYTLKENKAYSINFLGQPDAHPAIPMGFVPGADGIYTISASGHDAFEVLILEDLLTGTIHALGTQNIYQFRAQQGDDPLRFVLRFKALGTNLEALAQPHALYHQGELIVFNPAAEKAAIYLFDANGRKVQEFTLQETQQRFPFKPTPGFYVATLLSHSQVKVLKLIVP